MENNPQNLRDIRIHMLDNILWTLVFIAGISVVFSVSAQWQNGNFPLLFLYVIFYGAIVLVSAKKDINFHVRAALPLLVLTALILSEFFYFGTTALAYVFMYTLIIFAGLLYGFKAAIIALSLIVVTISIRFWLRQFERSAELGQSLFNVDVLSSWLSPIAAFVCCAAIAIVAITMMLRRLNDSLQDKDALVSELRSQIESTKEAQKALDVSEGQYTTLFQLSMDSLILVELASGKLLRVNQAAEKLLDMPAAKLLQKSLQDVMPDRAQEILTANMESETDRNFGDVAINNDEDSPRIASVYVTRISEDLAFIIARDETDKRELEAQFIHSQKMEAVGQLAGGVAHDFNNSLHAIMGFGETALAKNSDDEVQSYLGRLMDAGERARSLIGQLLAFSRHQVLEIINLNLVPAISELLALVRRVIGEHIELEFNYSEDSLMVSADNSQIEQILMNLCINARDAMGPKGTLSIELQGVELDSDFCAANSWARSGDYVKISVSDTGQGIDPEIQKRMFEPFYTTKEVGKGTGLGLSTVLGSVQQLDGLISVVSEPEIGTCIEVYLPRIHVEESEAPSVEREEIKPGSETVLLADDDDLVREVTQDMLQLAGYQVLTACNGEEALSIFENKSAEIDLVLLDVVMPTMSGNSVSKHIINHSPETPILFASGYSQDAIDTDFILDEGVNLIQKPYRRSALLSKVRDLLDHPSS